MKTEISPKRLILLQAVVILYTLSSVMAKFASGEEALEKIVFFFGMDLFFLGLYALFWQQLIKALPLSVAYANRAMALLWSALWARLIFGEKIGAKQIAGIVLVIIGILIINGDKKGSEREKERGSKMKQTYFLLAVCSVCIASVSQILLKKGAGQSYSSKIREYLNGYVITGYGMLFVSMVLTIMAYKHLSFLSIPVVEALGYILVPVLSFFVFRERITLRKTLGILCILAGIVVYYS